MPPPTAKVYCYVVMVSALVVLLVCGNGSIVIVVVFLLSLLSSCPSHLVDVVVVPVANPPAVKVDCYVFDGISARRPCLRQRQHCHHCCVVIVIIIVVSFSSC